MLKRTRRAEHEEPQELNLAPIMNLVVILIPLLLLSAVFVSVSVINVSTPKLISPAPVKAPEEEQTQRLTVAIGHEGFFVGTQEGTYQPQSQCGGATLCLAQPEGDLRQEFKRAAALIERGERQAGEEVMTLATDRYDWRQLYNTLVELKSKNPHINTLYISADPALPYAALVRLFDVSRNKLGKDRYESVASFAQARERRDERGQPAELFSDPMLTVLR